MQEFHRRVTSVTPRPQAEETSSDLLAGATLIPLADTGDFTDYGGHVRILGDVYAYVDMDEGDVSGVPSITLDTGLLVDVPAATIVEEWDDVRGEVVTDWIATVTDDLDGSTNTAVLTHSLIALISSGIPIVGESVTVRVDDAGDWWVTEVHGATPGYDPQFIRTGGLGADTVVWAGQENGRRAQLDGIDGAVECFNDANEQTVNLDGDVNYIEGTFATAASGSRVEIGEGDSALPTNEVRLYSGDADELEPATIRTFVSEIDPGFPQGIVTITSQDWAGAPDPRPMVALWTGTSDGSIRSRVGLEAEDIKLTGDVEVASGTLGATMGAGSVGISTFRDSVDARIAPTLATFGHIERSADNTQSITASTTTVVLWQTSNVAARGGITYSAGVFDVSVAGTYAVNAYIGLAASATGRRQFFGRVNGASRSGTVTPAPAVGAWVANVSFTVDLAAGDDIDFTTFQDSGGGLNVSQGYVTIHRVA